ncbi:MAG TPA: hypothetical protein VGJ28_20295 [Micromonosporaceae bacterium]
MASVAEVKAAIDSAIMHVRDSEIAVRAAGEQLGEAQQRLAAAVDGSAHDAVGVAQAALAQATGELDDCLTATAQAVEHAEAYAATL